MTHLLAIAITTLALALPCTLLDAQEQDASRPHDSFQIRHITGDLYRSGNGAWHAIFLVTGAGAILVDPLNVEHANWLKDELANRFDIPVKYVIYSHSHFDHAEGGAAFADTATFIAHERMLANMDGRYPNMPGDMIDRNGNGLIDREDIMVPTDADPGICGMSSNFFGQYDRDGDGVMTPAELQRDIVPPTVTYSDRMTITLGGKTVELLHPGRNHGDDMTVVLFPQERVVFASDMIADALVRDDIRSLPSACGPLDGHPIAEWIASYQAVLALDFDLFAGGHGDVFSKEELTLPLRFLEDLERAVAQGLAQGLSLEQMQRNILLEDYRNWAYYDRLRAKNIEAAYLNLSRLR